jgi:hypothetical protein
MSFSLLIALASVVWLLSCGASMLALYWSLRAGSTRWRGPLVLSCVALLASYVGLSRVQFHASKTVNGNVEWSFNSRWFFLAALVLGAASLAISFWKYSKVRGLDAAASRPDSAGENSGEEPDAASKDGATKPVDRSGLAERPPMAS